MYYVRHMRDLERKQRFTQAQMFSQKGTVMCNFWHVLSASFSSLVWCPLCTPGMKCKEADKGIMKSNNTKQFGSSKELWRKYNGWFLPVWHSLLFMRLKAGSRKNKWWIYFQQVKDYAQTVWNTQKVRDLELCKAVCFSQQSWEISQRVKMSTEFLEFFIYRKEAVFSRVPEKLGLLAYQKNVNSKTNTKCILCVTYIQIYYDIDIQLTPQIAVSQRMRTLCLQCPQTVYTVFVNKKSIGLCMHD